MKRTWFGAKCAAGREDANFERLSLHARVVDSDLFDRVVHETLQHAAQLAFFNEDACRIEIADDLANHAGISFSFCP